MSSFISDIYLKVSNLFIEKDSLSRFSKSSLSSSISSKIQTYSSKSALCLVLNIYQFSKFSRKILLYLTTLSKVFKNAFGELSIL
jgi:hypothetical protein